MQICAEVIIPGQPARHAKPPPWLLNSPMWPEIVQRTQSDELYLHQAEALQIIHQGHNLVVSTGTASGKSLIMQTPVIHHLAQNPNATAIAIYPIKALARDQLNTWRDLAQAAGLNPNSINRIDGDLHDLTQRRETLQRTSVALMTPDVIHQWLLGYSEPMYDKRPLRQDLREVQNTQYNVRRFISNLSHLIIDEAHAYDRTIGTHCLYVFHRLQQKRRELMPEFKPLRVIAASATISNPAEHLAQLTGLRFQSIDESRNGAPRSELTVQHAVARHPRSEGWIDLQQAISEVIAEHPDRSYIAFVDDRQLAERTAAGIEAAHAITEDAIITESRDSMAYRAGLMSRERIEDALRNGGIRGIASTSAMEMGIDISDLNVGFNLGVPHSIARAKQRAGRVGRRSPGRFIIMAPREALRLYHDSLEHYWHQPVEPARLYPQNPHIKNTHGRCLAKETDLNGRDRQLPNPEADWPEQLPDALRQIARGEHYAPEFQTADPQQPHRSDIRDADPAPASIVQIMPDASTQLLTNDVSRRDAARDAYPLAAYYHAKQSYTVRSWDEDERRTLVTVEHDIPHETIPVIVTGATVTLQAPRTSKHGHVEHAPPSQAFAWESITGCYRRLGPEQPWQRTSYADVGIPEITTRVNTTATIVIVWQPWFDDPATRRNIANALKAVLCARQSIHPADIRTTHQNVRIVRDGKPVAMERAIVVWDKTTGGLGLSKAVADHLGDYARDILSITRHNPQATNVLDHETAELFLRWTKLVAPNTHAVNAAPVVTEYTGVTFRSKLEASWAAHFDAQRIPWQYEPRHFSNWSPDFLLTIADQQVYAEVKPVREFPMDVAQKLLASPASPDVIILGANPRAAWRYSPTGWTPLAFDQQHQPVR